jgi:D-alanyl-D-alanine carboxypeptidase (penicillin-binding protein 5/6)
MGGSQIYLKEGEQMTAEDLIKSVVVASANDAAVALAEHICGSEELFVQKMNDKARELGMVNTHFENTNGLDDTAKNHVTSARDIAIMSRALISHRKILEYSSIWMDSIRNGEFGLTNTNRLIRFYKGATGLKTGSTAKAKFCVSATAERNGMSLICVVMAAPTRDIRNAIATSLLDYGFSGYALYRNEKSEIEDVRVIGGIKERCSVSEVDFCKVLSKNEAAKISRTVELEGTVAAPIRKGDKVGRCVYRFGDTIIGESDIVATEDVEKIDFIGLLCRMLAKMVFC